MNNFFSITRSYRNRYDRLITQALADGLGLFDKYYHARSLPQQSLASYYYNFLIYQRNCNDKLYLNNPELFSSDQCKLYEEIYSDSNNFSDRTKLFLEFMLGLCRFSLSLNIFLEFYKYLSSLASLDGNLVNNIEQCDCSHCKQGNEFWMHLHNLALLGKEKINHLITTTNNFQSVDFWKTANTFFTACPNLKKLAKHIMSMQFIPQEKKIIGLAQMLHFGGFAGDGRLIKKYSQLKPLLEYTIGYHNKERGGFNNRFDVILQQLNAAKLYTNTVGTKLLLNYQDGNLKILDVGSGPVFAGSSAIIESLIKHKRKVELTASDVDAASLLHLKKLSKKNSSPIDIRYLDLNFVDQIPKTSISENNFDAVIASLVLHQIDQQDIIAVFNFFIKLLKPGGYILNTDVGIGGYYQVLLNSSNAIDREGRTILWQDIDFKLISVRCANNQVKIAYPLKNLVRSFPETQQLYSFAAYKIAIIHEENLEKLSNLWQMNKFAEADAFFNKSSKYNILL